MLWMQITDPTGGWVSMASQIGAVGLLALLVWQMPKIMKDLRDEREKQRELERDERERRDAQHDNIILALQKDFNHRTTLLSESIDLQTKELVSEFGKGSEAVEKLCKALGSDPINLCRAHEIRVNILEEMAEKGIFLTHEQLEIVLKKQLSKKGKSDGPRH